MNTATRSSRPSTTTSPAGSARSIARSAGRLRHDGRAAPTDGAGRGTAVPRGPAVARRPAGLLGPARRRVLVVTRRRSTRRRSSTSRTGRPGLGWDPDGRMLVVSMDDRRLLRLDGTATHRGRRPQRARDLALQRHGRRRGRAGLRRELRVRPRHPGRRTGQRSADSGRPRRVASTVAAEDMRFPNGTVITPDGATLIVGESYGGCLTAFDVADRRRALEPAGVGAARGRGAGRHLSRRRGCDLVGVSADRSRPAGASRAARSPTS